MSEVPREPADRPLTPIEIAAITSVVFQEDSATESPIFFVFGTIQGDWNRMASLMLASNAQVIATGKSALEGGPPVLSAHIREQLEARHVPSSSITEVPDSTNTLQDVTFALPSLREIAGDLDQYDGRIVYVAKAHHSGRCYLTLRRFLPNATLDALVFPAFYDNRPVTAGDWHDWKIGRARVLGEAMRIARYSSKGDIARPETDMAWLLT
jgi:uncharacterized SAM-binding protein YcdF (DUF218 family)